MPFWCTKILPFWPINLTMKSHIQGKAGKMLWSVKGVLIFWKALYSFSVVWVVRCYMKRRNQLAECEKVMRGTVINVYHCSTFSFIRMYVHMVYVFAVFAFCLFVCFLTNYLNASEIFLSKSSLISCRPVPLVLLVWG